MAAKKRNATPKGANATIIDNVNLTVEAFIGETSLTIGELNALEADSLIELNSDLNQFVELRLNGLPIAQGELVVVGDKFGVRVTALEQ